MKKNIRGVVLLVLVLSLLLSGCGGGSEVTNGSNESGGSGSVGKADPSTLVVASAADARSIDPHGAGDNTSVNALMPVVETLVVYDENGEIKPHLAESWEEIDSQTWKFKLREGVLFHNGEEMKASDVVYSFKRATSPLGARVQYIMKMVDPDGLEIVDDYTVIVRTTQPFSPFVGYLPYIGAAIISEKAYEEPGADLNPVGTGPFKFVEWKKGDTLSYERFNDYWGEQADYERLVIKAIPEANSRLIELETGSADIAITMTVNDQPKIESNSNLDLHTSPTTIFTMLGFNCSIEPYNNAKFRQAIDWATDAEGIVQAVYRGSAVYTPGPVTPKQKYYDDSEPNDRYDVEKARKLLEESGVDLSKTYTIYVNESQPRIDIATILQSQLSEVGVNIEIKVMETAAYWDFIASGDQEMFISGWGAVGFPEPDNNIYGPLHSNQIPANNNVFYSDPELDAMLDLSREMSDGPEREELVKDIQKHIRENAPYITFDNPINIIGTQKYIKGFVAMPTSHQVYNSVIVE
ncbi:MAG: ABC transporter substrate-binding protein [Gudongella sp.]|nr:ABC transporter substrate-binding protein [Gudongella sp.]